MLDTRRPWIEGGQRASGQSATMQPCTMRSRNEMKINRCFFLTHPPNGRTMQFLLPSFSLSHDTLTGIGGTVKTTRGPQSAAAAADNNVLQRYLPASDPPNQRKQHKRHKHRAQPSRSPQRRPHRHARRSSSTAGGQSPLRRVRQSSAAVPRRLERVGELGGIRSRRRSDCARCHHQQRRGGHRHEPNGIALRYLELSRHRQAR